ncbi:relaxase/mobilization nuclease domain-containing protein [Rhodoblastus sp.]|jgi:type IV secretory pathway VirD2 relaxase|uniref:relaxase/mobilization nuclease domain-containing protein n=1 Tax=Rhodoblastus sp. TaxID=1962975 RepID=UPI0025D26515|nr:relaxase/mobilization nuclease domain-containing protein [Rhodoblastus sp.]
MSRAAQIDWWLTQVEATRRAVSDARGERQRLRPSGLFDDAPSARQTRATPTMEAPATPINIRGTTITGNGDDERRRILPTASGGGAATASAGAPSPASEPIAGGFSSSGKSSSSLGRARQLAAGYQPAVIKVVSYARGAARAMATGQYVQREEVALETHDGRQLTNRESVAEEIKEWSTRFAKRAESQDVTALRLKLHGVGDTPEGRETYEKAIAAGFDGHRFAYRIDASPSGELEARLVVATAGAPKERFRIREERIRTEEDGFMRRRPDARSETAIQARIEAATGHPPHAMSVDPGAAGHGRDGVAYRLNQLVEKGAAVDDRGSMIANPADVRLAMRQWGPSLRSQSSRDTMHLIISAKAGTDVAGLSNAARAFLHDRFADHKFMFGVHTDKEADGHIHVHAIITVKNESGQKIHPSRDTFRDWREAYAAHAQAQGLKIVATSAKERASSQSYGPKDKAIVDAAEKPRPAREARDRAYAADPANQRLIDNARQRIHTAQTNPIRLPASEQDRRAVNESISAWAAVARENPENAAARDMLKRLGLAQTIGGILHTIENRVGHLTKEDHGMAITSKQMAKDLRLMNEAVSGAADLLGGATKQQFQETSARYLETLANRIDLQRAQERGVQELSRAEVEKIAGVDADRLIERAEAIRDTEAREAAEARRFADRAVEAERRQDGRGGIDPESQRELRAERAIVAGSQQVAARETREAAAAIEAANLLADHPARPLPQALIENDALAKLRAEQEKVLREIEGERGETQSSKGQRME